MQIEETSRSLLIFNSALKSDATQSDYSYRLKAYLLWSGKGSFDDLINREPKEIQTELENYLMELTKSKSSHAIKMAFYAIFLFYSMNNVIINQTLLKKMFPTNDELTEAQAYTTEQIKTILETIPKRKTSALQYKAARLVAIIHFFAATGIRVGALNWLKLEHLEPIKNCYSVKVYAKTPSQYFTFLTPEARHALDEYLDMRRNLFEVTPQDPIFDIELDALKMVMSRLMSKTQIRKPSGEDRFDIPMFHGFRKRFNTILKSNMQINPAAIERMMGHHSQTISLDTAYYKPTLEILFSEYEKGIDALTVYNPRQ